MRRWEVYHTVPPSPSFLPSSAPIALSFSRIPSFRFSRRRYNRFPRWCSPAFWEKIEPVCKTKKALPATRGLPLFPALCLARPILPTLLSFARSRLMRIKAIPELRDNGISMSSRRKSRRRDFNLIVNKNYNWLFFYFSKTIRSRTWHDDRHAFLAKLKFTREQNRSENNVDMNLRMSATSNRN